MANVLVLAPDESLHLTAQRHLRDVRLVLATNAWRGLELLRSRQIDVVLLDLSLPDAIGLLVIDEIRAERNDIEVIALGPAHNIELAVGAVKRGAFDFLAKDHGAYDRLPQLVRRALEHRRRRLDAVEAQSRDAWVGDAFDLLERSEHPGVVDMVRRARVLANTEDVILLRGEPGCGKELFARYMHALSDRANERFVAVSIPSVPPSLMESELFGHVKGAFAGGESRVGKLELAEGGTLFLGEVSALPEGAQAQLVKALRTREVTRLGGSEARPTRVTLVASTAVDLADEVHSGRFNGELYALLGSRSISIPPLRERSADLPDLVALLARKHAATMHREAPRFAQEAMDILVGNDWPGNVRELDGLIMRLAATHGGATVSPGDIPPEYWLASLHRRAAAIAEALDSPDPDAPGGGVKEDRLYFLAREQFERYLVRLMVKRCGGNKRAAARVLGVSYSTVKDKSRD